jgi:excisionase family DNA binding protein
MSDTLKFMRSPLPGVVGIQASEMDLATTIEAKRGTWTAEQLAVLFELSPKTIYAMAKSGRIPVYRFGASIRFDPKIVADWVRARSSAA